MEFKVDKPVDLNANSEERYLKDINITVDDTNIIENIEKNEVVQIKHGKFRYYLLTYMFFIFQQSIP